MTKLVEDYFDRLAYGKGAHRTKVTITGELGGVDEFYILSQNDNFDDVKKRIRALYSHDQRYNQDYHPYALEYVKFFLSEPIPDQEQRRVFFAALRRNYIYESTRLTARHHCPEEWDRARERFEKALPRHIDHILETALITED